MKTISDTNLLRSYVQKNKLDDFFDDAFIDEMELLLFDKSEIIFSKGVDLEYMYFLVKGTIKIYMLQDNGKLLLIRLNQPLNILGDIEFLTHYQTQCHVESLDESLLIGIQMKKLREAASSNVNFLQFIIKNLSAKLFTLSNSATINVLYPLENRIASYLLSIYQSTSDSNNEFAIPKLTEISTLLGTSYRHLNRTLSQLSQKGIIQKKKGIIVVKDLKALEDLSRGNIYENNLLLK